MVWGSKTRLCIAATLVFLAQVQFLFCAEPIRQLVCEPVASVLESASASRVQVAKGQSSVQPAPKAPAARTADSLCIEAHKYFVAANKERAEEAYMAAIEQNPSLSSAFYAISCIKTEKREFLQAIEFAKKAVELDSSNIWYRQNLFSLYNATQQFEAALEQLSALRKLDSTDFESAYKMAEIYFLIGEKKKSAAVFDTLEAMFEPCDEWSMKKYEIYRSMGDFKAARLEIEKISRFIPAQSKYYEILAQLAIREKDFKRAYSYYQEILRIKPNDPYAYASLSDFYRKQGEEIKALEYLEKAIIQSDLDGETRLNLVYTYFSDKNLNLNNKAEVFLCERILDTLVGMYPSNVRLLLIKSMFHTNKNTEKDSRIAHDVLKKVLEIDPANIDAYRFLLFVKQDLNDWNGIIEYANKGRAIFANNIIFPVYLCAAYHNTKQCDSTIRYGIEAIKHLDYISGDEYYMWGSIVYTCVADCFWEKRDIASYRDVMTEAMNRYNNDPFIINNYSYQMALLKLDLDVVENMMEAVVKKNPNQISFCDTYAWVLFQKGKYKEALSVIKLAIKNGGNKEAVLQEHYGDILFKNNNLPQAIKAWKTALELYPSDTDKAIIDILRLKIESKQWIEAKL